jgi:hypothetical protein
MNNNVKEIIKNAFSHSLAINIIKNKDKNKMPNELVDYFSNKINPNSLQDKDLIKNKELHDNINWEIIEKNKAVRILARDIDLLEKIDLNKLGLTISELFPLFLQYPELIKQMVDDFDSLSPNESIKLLECNPDLIDLIDISKYNYSKKDMIILVGKFKRSEKIMERINLNELDHFLTRKLLIETGIDYVDKLNLKQLKNTDWMEILEKQPDLLEYCDLRAFDTNDCYLLTKLVLMFPELSYLIEKNKDKISALGWENLIKEDLDNYEDICPWEKFSELNWINIIRKHPHLSILKQNYYLF